VNDDVLEVIATARAFAERSGAERVVLLVDRDGEVLMVDVGSAGAVQVDDGERTYALAAGAPVEAAARSLPDIRPAPATALWLDTRTGELEAPLGVVANLGSAVLGLARAFGGRSVASVDFATRDPDAPMTIAAREGEPLVIASGDKRFTLPPEAVGG
jgi:hypothetical protein